MPEITNCDLSLFQKNEILGKPQLYPHTLALQLPVKSLELLHPRGQQILSVPGLPHTSLYSVIVCYSIPYKGIMQQILTYFELCRVTAS